MGRPAVIVPEKVAEAALALIDEEGLDALSMERLARRLGVRGPSLYHHFADKAVSSCTVSTTAIGCSPTTSCCATSSC